MKNIYYDHMIIRMIQIGSSEDQKIIMILVILDLRIFSDDLGDRWEKDHKDPRSLDRFLKMRKILIHVFIGSSQMIFGWSRSKIFEANKFYGYQFPAIMINNIYKFSKTILFEP